MVAGPRNLRLTHFFDNIDAFLGDLAPTRLDRLPEFVVEDPQLGNLGDDQRDYVCQVLGSLTQHRCSRSVVRNTVTVDDADAR